MGKSTKSVTYNVKGVLDLENGTVTEISKEEEVVYDFTEILAQFDGKEIAMSIKETSEIVDEVVE